jgi:hypothetical protein
VPELVRGALLSQDATALCVLKKTQQSPRHPSPAGQVSDSNEILSGGVRQKERDGDDDA